MSVVELLVNVMGPVMLIVGVGWLAGRQLDFDIQTLARLAFWVLGAAFVLDVFADAELDRTLVVRLVLVALGSMAVATMIAVAAGRFLGLNRSRTSAAAMTSSYGNVGNAGLAISVFAFGDDAAALAAVLMIAINIPGIVLGIGLATSRNDGSMLGLRRALLTPMTIAAGVAVVMNAFEWSFPIALDRSISLLGNALIPVMLLTLGMQLAAATTFVAEVDLGLVAGVKLLVVPAVAAALGAAIGIEGDALGVLVIQSSMPPAVFCSVVALEFEFEPERVTRTVLATTLLSLATIPIVLVLVT